MLCFTHFIHLLHGYKFRYTQKLPECHCVAVPSEEGSPQLLMQLILDFFENKSLKAVMRLQRYHGCVKVSGLSS